METPENPDIRSCVGLQYPIVRGILSHLSYLEIVLCKKVCKLWYSAARNVLRERRNIVETFHWTNGSGKIHSWYDICGNKLLSFHAQCGLHSRLQTWIQESMQNFPHLVLFFGTGVTYLNYLSSKHNHFIVYGELITALTLFSSFQSAPNLTSIFFTSLKVINTTNSTLTDDDKPSEIKEIPPSLLVTNSAVLIDNSDWHNNYDIEEVLDFSLLSVPSPPESISIKPFHVTETILKETPVILNEPKLDLLTMYFKILTGIDPEEIRILGIVILNLGDLTHIIRRVWQDYGPFALIGCDSEALCWNFVSENPKVTLYKIDDYKTCSSGFVIAESRERQEGKKRKIRTASVVLDISVVDEEHIRNKLSPLVDAGLTGPGSWAIMLSSCVRGFDGEDINREVIERKNRIQKLETETFKKICKGTRLIGTQVDDIFGVDHITTENDEYEEKPIIEDYQKDGMGLYTPEIIADDSSTVIFVAKYL